MSDQLRDRFRFFSVPTAILEDESLTVNEKMVYVVLRSHCNAYDQTAWPSYKRISKLSGTSERTVIRAIDSLIKKGYLIKEVRPDSSRGNKTNLYTLDLPDVTESPPGCHTDTTRVSQSHPPGVTESPEVNHLSNSFKEEEEEKNIGDDVSSVFGIDPSKLSVRKKVFVREASRHKIPIRFLKEIVKNIDIEKYDVRSIMGAFLSGSDQLEQGVIYDYPKWFLKAIDNAELTTRKIKERDVNYGDATRGNMGVL